MKFKYNARNQEGELQTGFVEAANSNAAVNILKSHNLFVLSLESAEKRHWYNDISDFFNRIKTRDLMIFTRQFATLIEAQMPLTNALDSLFRQTKNPLLKEAIMEIRDDVESGLSLSQALERQNHIFSDFYVNMIRTAEVVGRLEESMLYLADYLDKETVWEGRLKNAMIYPAFLVIAFFIVAGIMVTIVFPQLQPVFAESNTPLPLITHILLGSGNFVARWWWAILVIFALFIFMLIDYLRTNEGRAMWHELSIRLPVFGDLFKKIYIARFAELTSVLIKGGVPLTQALEISSHAVGNVVYRDILHAIAERVKAGAQLSSLLFEVEYYFPPMVAQMAAVGESSGKLSETLSRVSSFYTREVNDLLDNLVELIQPILIVSIAVFVGLLFAALLIPIYNLSQSL
jgi:type IV pilus assembly protein PilC